MLKWPYIAVLFLLPVFVSGCGASAVKVRPVPADNVSVQPDIQEQELADSSQINYKKEYKINPSELLDITVYQEPDLERTVRVTNDGYISFPLIGKVHVAGLTVIEAESKIASLLGQGYLIDPQISVFIKEFQTEKVVIIGEVKNPGSFDLPQDRELTLLEAIALAGGFTKVASIDGIRVIRVENGVQKYIPVRVSDITKEGDKSKDIVLKPGDIIYVPERIF